MVRARKKPQDEPAREEAQEVVQGDDRLALPALRGTTTGTAGSVSSPEGKRSGMVPKCGPGADPARSLRATPGQGNLPATLTDNRFLAVARGELGPEAPEIARRLFWDWEGTVEEFLAALDRAEATKGLYRQGLRRFGRFLAEQKVEIPLPPAVLGFKRDLIAEKLAPATVNAYLIVLGQFFKTAQAKGLYPDIVALSGVTSIRLAPGFKRRGLSLDEIQTFLATFDPHAKDEQTLRNYALALTMLTTGLRQHSIRHASLEDLHQEGEHLILHYLSKGKQTKTGRAVIPPGTWAAIQKYLDARGSAEPEEALFGSVRVQDHGTHVTRQAVGKVLQAHLEAAGLHGRDVKPHSLRHTTAIQALDAGVSLDMVQQLLGHADVRTTMIYSHSRDRLANAPEYKTEDRILGKRGS